MGSRLVERDLAIRDVNCRITGKPEVMPTDLIRAITSGLPTIRRGILKDDLDLRRP